MLENPLHRTQLNLNAMQLVDVNDLVSSCVVAADGALGMWLYSLSDNPAVRTLDHRPLMAAEWIGPVTDGYRIRD